MKQDDALEMFVRFNSGGKALRKSEITMSILEAYWPSAKTEFGKLLVDSYNGFGSDFIIRCALMIYGDVVKSNISKQIANELKNNWGEFKKALKNLEIVLKDMNIGVSRFASSWNVLLPIIYFIYYNPEYKNNLDGIRAYLIRAILFTYFQSGTTGKLQQMKSRINENDYEITVDMLNQMNDLRVTDGKIEDVLNSEKGGRVAGEALYYLSLDWRKKHVKYEQDHLHPHERFDGNKPISVSMEDWRKWRGNRNRLANLHLLEGRSNLTDLFPIKSKRIIQTNPYMPIFYRMEPLAYGKEGVLVAERLVDGSDQYLLDGALRHCAGIAELLRLYRCVRKARGWQAYLPHETLYHAKKSNRRYPKLA